MMELPLKRILVTNDDGFDAPGLQIMAEVARLLSHDVWIIAPHMDQSGMGQSVSINNNLRCQKRGENQWAVSGTPADCVILGTTHLMVNAPPSLILSGVNAGENVGDDINLSGTTGAAFTGLLLGVPSIAVSLYRSLRPLIRWETARTILPDLLENFIKEGWDKNYCLSINIPDRLPEEIEGLSWTRPARKTIPSFDVEERQDLRQKNYYWIYPHKNHQVADQGSDIAALMRGEVSVTALSLDRSAPVITTPFGKKTANDE